MLAATVELMIRSWFAFVLLVACLVVTGCTSFATLRSAEVQPGPSFTVQGSVTTPPGNEPAWFWSLDCGQQCDRAIASWDLNLTFGHAPATGATAYAMGLGLSGAYPYLDAYVQLKRGAAKPYGVGARIGIPVTSWNEYQIYGRYDVRLAQGEWLLLSPAVFYHTGNSPDRENPGSFVAFVQGVGLLIEGEHVSFTPAISVIVGRGERRSYSEQIGPFATIFGMASVGVTFHPRRTQP